jgi:hypothetical protein
MSKPPNSGSQLKDLAVVSGGGNEMPVARGVPPTYDGTIASACESLDISLGRMIKTLRWARESDPRVAQFFDVWDALDSSERLVWGTVEAVRQRAGLKPLELLGIVADMACRRAMYEAQIIAAVALPSIVERSIETALTDKGIADRKILFLHSGFLPSTKNSQTAFSAMRDAHAKTSERARVVSAPSPEDTIRRAANRFNEALGLPPTAAPALPERASGQTFPETIPEDEEGDGE